MTKLPSEDLLEILNRHHRTTPKPKKLTKDQRDKLFSKPNTNAGAGWVSKRKPIDPRLDDEEEDTTP